MHSASGASTYEARVNDTAGVRVVITPKTFTLGQPTWDFEIILDTHTKPLTEDLARTTLLIDRASRRFVPTALEGDAPGGHHRKGVLKFPPPAETLKAFELQIESVGGAPRTFRWEVK